MIFEMMQWRLPPLMMLLPVLLQFAMKRRQELCAEFIELFSGEAAVSGALRGRGLVGSSHDLEYGEHYDLTQPAGFLPLALDICSAALGPGWR